MPRATKTMVVSVSHLILWCLICYGFYLIRKDFSIKRFCLQFRYYNYGLALLAAYNTAESLFRVIMGLSDVNLDGHASLPPFELRTSGVNGYILAMLLNIAVNLCGNSAAYWLLLNCGGNWSSS